MIKKIIKCMLVIMLCITLLPVNHVHACEDYRAWAQSDPRWGSLKLGNSSKTCSKVGCLVTAVSKTIIQASLKDQDEFDPGVFIKWLNKNNGFYSANFDWDKAEKYIPEFENCGRLMTKGTYSSKSYNNKLINYIKSGYHLLLNVNSGGHWIAVDEKKTLETGTVYIMDSLKSKPNCDITLSSRYSTFNQVHAYRGGELLDLSPVISDVKATVDDKGCTITCKVSDDNGITKVMFPTWNVKNERVESEKFLGTYKDGQATYRVNLADFNYETGEYQSDIIAYDTKGNTTVESVTYTLKEVQMIKDGYYNISSSSHDSKLLDGTSRTLENIKNNHDQEFYLKHDHDNYYKIINYNDKKVLDNYESTYLTFNNENNNDSQLWKFIKNDSGYYHIMNKHTNLYLNVKDNQACLCELSDHDNQLWHITQPITEVKLNKESVYMSLSDKYNLTYDVLPSNTLYDKTLSWSSLDDKIASVDNNGSITANNVGTTTITALSSNGVKTDCLVKVSYPNPFKDMNNPTIWYYDYVLEMNHLKLMTGLDKESFGPSSTTTRAMMATVLYRIAKSPEVKTTSPFEDVTDQNIWYYNPITWAASQGIITGHGDGTYFKPEDNVTREQLALMLMRYASSLGYDVSSDVDLSRFTDGHTVSPWAKDAIKWAVENNIMSGGTDGYMRPQNDATRAECAKMLLNFYKYIHK